MTDVSIKCFLSAADTGSFAKAADSLFMTRQGVSRQMLKLEKELDCQLFHRETSQVSLTPEGRLYYTLFSDFMKRLAETGQTVRQMATAARGKITINAIKGLDITDYLRNITACIQDESDVDCLISFHEPHELDEILPFRDFDLIISYGEPDRLSAQGYNAAIIDHVGTFLAVSDNYPGPRGNCAADYCGADLSTWRRKNEADEVIIENTQRIIHDAGLTVGEINIYPNMESAFTAIELGKGVGLCSSNSTLVQRPGIRILPLPISSNVLCFWKDDPGNAVVQKIIGVISSVSHQEGR